MNLFCRSDTIESVLCETLFPIEFSIKDKVKHWVRVFSGFDKVEVKALEKLLEQKQRFVSNVVLTVGLSVGSFVNFNFCVFDQFVLIFSGFPPLVAGCNKRCRDICLSSRCIRFAILESFFTNAWWIKLEFLSSGKA